jgi:hypothetical protein
MYRSLAAKVRFADRSTELLTLDEITRRLRFTGQRHGGVRTIPTRAIVGTG